MMRKILLRLYPAAWRKEYGEEFAEMLASRPLTFRIVADVLASAIRQRLRDTPLWLTAGACLFTSSFTQLILYSHGLISKETHLAVVEYATIALTGLWMASRTSGTFRSGLAGAFRTTLIGYGWFIPCFLFGIVHLPGATPVSGAVAMSVRVLFGGVGVGGFGALCGTAIRKLRGRVA